MFFSGDFIVPVRIYAFFEEEMEKELTKMKISKGRSVEDYKMCEKGRRNGI